MALLYGKPVADKILADTENRIRTAGVVPGLAVILIGDDAPSHLYVGLKEKAAQKIGIRFEKFLFAADVVVEKIFLCIDALNERADIHGIIVQLPLPETLDADKIIARIDPKKDTDGFHAETLRSCRAGNREACPVFPRAVIELLRAGKGYAIGEKGLVLANSELLGRVMVQALALEGLRAEYILSSAPPETISEKTKSARVIVTACGIANMLIGGMLSEKSIVIDGGATYLDGKVVGDADRASVENKTCFLSPVPGGVGPVTVAMLLARVTEAALRI